MKIGQLAASAPCGKNLVMIALMVPDRPISSRTDRHTESHRRGPTHHKLLPASQTVDTALIAPNNCQSQSPTIYSECSRFHPNQFTLDGVIAESVNTAIKRRKVNLIFR